MKISISLFSFMLLGCCSFLGLMLLFFAMLLWGFNSPLTGIALLAGLAFLLLGCLLWAHKLPWYVALAIGGMTFAAAWFAGAYVPLLVSYKGEDMPGFLIHLLNVTLGVPGIALILAGVANVFRSLRFCEINKTQTAGSDQHQSRSSMKMPMVIMLVMALAGATASGGHPENIITESSVRSFQHENGKTVRARVAAYNPKNNEVTLAREDRRTFSLDLGVFSEADRTYVREWHSIKDFFRQDCLHISAGRRPVRGEVEHLIWRSEEIVVYDITLENRCDFDMNDLVLEYNIYYRVHEPNTPEPNADQGFKCGRLKIQRLAAGKQIKVKTLPVPFPKEDLFEYYRDGKAPAVKHLGIRLRIYLPLDSGRKAMREFATPDALLKNCKWTTP